MKLKTIFTIMLASSLSACSHQPIRFHYSVPPSSITKADMYGCDSASPPHCQKIRLTYAKNAEQLVAQQVTK